MRKFLTFFLLTTTALILWAVLVFAATLNGWLHTPLASKNDTNQFIIAAKKLIANNTKGSTAFALIEKGNLYSQYFLSSQQEINEDTLFQSASLSKWLTAWGVMSLVERGLLDLDKPVSNYLTRWQLPESEFDPDGVTIRRILSHTAGLADGLGYAGFSKAEEKQSLEASLTGAKSSWGEVRSVSIGHSPGSKFQYSGGGYSILQLLIEEITQQTFVNYMEENVLIPLGMINSTYYISDSNDSNVAQLINADGTIAKHKHFTALAAASFYTSLSDMIIFLQAHQRGSNGEPIGRNVIGAETIKMMQRAHASMMGADIWGLGIMLYAPNNQGGYIIGHGGKRNNPPVNVTIRLDPATADGIILLETGDPLLAVSVGAEWVYWKTNNVDLTMFKMGIDAMKTGVLAGWLLIVLLSLIAWLRLKKQ